VKKNVPPRDDYNIILYIVHAAHTIIITITPIVDRGLLLLRVHLAADDPIEVSRIPSSHDVVLFATNVYIIPNGRRISWPWPSCNYIDDII